MRQAQYLFLAAWIAETGEKLEALPSASGVQCVMPGTVALMFGTGPSIHGNAMSDMFVAAIYTAREELLVTTPYFAPDEALLRALCAAPRRGVKTTIVFRHATIHGWSAAPAVAPTQTCLPAEWRHTNTRWACCTPSR